MSSQKAPPTPASDPKRMNRQERLKIAKQWAASLTTNKKIRAYQKYFAVDKLCAAKELTMAGVPLTEKYASRWATRHKRIALTKKRKRISRPDPKPLEPDSDENFYYIAGYTSGGFAYGITWEEAEREGLQAYD